MGRTPKGIVGQYRNYYEGKKFIERKIVEASFILVEYNCISQKNKDISTIWRKNIWKGLLHSKVGSDAYWNVQ